MSLISLCILLLLRGLLGIDWIVGMIANHQGWCARRRLLLPQG
jgi:hypothetical protein